MTEVALVEDDPIVRQNYSEMLTEYGYTVGTFANRASAEAAFTRKLPDVVLLDVSLESDRDAGFALCRWVRSLSEKVIIMMLSARGSDIDVISGLRVGADDYVTKESSVDVLVAKIENRLERAASTTVAQPAEANDKELELGKLKMSLLRHESIWAGEKVELTVTQFRMLWNICQHPGQVKTPSNLMDAANKCIEPNTVAVHVKGIRDAFKKIDDDFASIRTEHGLGYRWIE